MTDLSPAAQALLVYSVLALGVLATVLTGFAQLRSVKGALGDRAALASRRGMLAASTGMGSVAGSLLALEVGGPGAIGWMWIATLLGMGLIYAEVLLAVRHRRTGVTGQLESATTHVLERAGGKPLAVVLAIATVATLLGVVPMIEQLPTSMKLLAGGGGLVLVSLLALGIKHLATVDTGKPHAILFGLLIMVFAIAAGSLLQTQQASLLLASLGGDRWMVAVVLVAATTAGIAVPKWRGFVVALGPVAVGLYVVALVWLIARAPGDPGAALQSMFLGIFGSTDAIVGGAAGGGVLLAMQAGFLRATLATEAGLGSVGFTRELDHARSPERSAASAMAAPLIAGVLVPTLTALTALTATPWVGQRIDEPAERRAAAYEREATPAELQELADSLTQGDLARLHPGDHQKVAALWAPLEQPMSRGTAASLQTGQTVVLPKDAVVDADAGADVPGLRRDYVHPMLMRGSPRGTKVPHRPGENQILLTASPESLAIREVVFRSDDSKRADYSAFDLRIPVANTKVVRNGIEGLSLTPIDPAYDFDKLAARRDGPYVVFGDYHFEGRIVKMFQTEWGLHDAVVEANTREKHQLSLRNTVPTASWRGPYLDVGEPRAPMAMVAKADFDAPIGSRVSLEYRSPERGLDIGVMLPGGEYSTPPWAFLEHTTHAVLRHEDPSRDIRVRVSVRLDDDGTLHFTSAEPTVVDFATWKRWVEYTGPYLEAPAYGFETEVHTATRFPASSNYLQRIGEQRSALTGPFAERRTLVAIHEHGEPQGSQGELYDPHPAEVAPFMDGPWVTGTGIVRLGLASELSQRPGTELLLAISVMLLALTTMITWAGDGARAAEQVFGRGAGLGFCLAFLVAGLGGAALDLLPVLRVVDHLMIGLIVLNGTGLIVLLVRERGVKD